MSLRRNLCIPVFIISRRKILSTQIFSAVPVSPLAKGELIATWAELPRSLGHVLYDRLQEGLIADGIDLFAETACQSNYAPKMGHCLLEVVDGAERRPGKEPLARPNAIIL